MYFIELNLRVPRIAYTDRAERDADFRTLQVFLARRQMIPDKMTIRRIDEKEFRATDDPTVVKTLEYVVEAQ